VSKNGAYLSGEILKGKLLVRPSRKGMPRANALAYSMAVSDEESMLKAFALGAKKLKFFSVPLILKGYS
jgi:hypothetical protein